MGTGDRSAGSGPQKDFSGAETACLYPCGLGVGVKGSGRWGALGFRSGIPESFVLWSPVLILSATLK